MNKVAHILDIYSTALEKLAAKIQHGSPAAGKEVHLEMMRHLSRKTQNPEYGQAARTAHEDVLKTRSGASGISPNAPKPSMPVRAQAKAHIAEERAAAVQRARAARGALATPITPHAAPAASSAATHAAPAASSAATHAAPAVSHAAPAVAKPSMLSHLKNPKLLAGAAIGTAGLAAGAYGVKKYLNTYKKPDQG